MGERKLRTQAASDTHLQKETELHEKSRGRVRVKLKLQRRHIPAVWRCVDFEFLAFIVKCGPGSSFLVDLKLVRGFVFSSSSAQLQLSVL